MPVWLFQRKKHTDNKHQDKDAPGKTRNQKYFKGKTDRETERQGDTETQRHRDTVSEKCLSMSLKILDPWDNLGSHLDQTNKEWLDTAFVFLVLSSFFKRQTNYELFLEQTWSTLSFWGGNQIFVVARIITLARTKLLQYDCSNWVQDQQCKQRKLRAINFQHFHGIHMEAKSVMENWGHLCTLFAFNRKPLNKLWSLIISVPFESPVDFRDVVVIIKTCFIQTWVNQNQ